jgi:integrase
MATVYRYSGKPQWFARFFDADGKRISRATGTESKRRAKEIAADLESKERAKRAGDPHTPKAFAAILETATREATNGELTLARAEDLIRRLHQIANPSFRVVSLKDHLDAWVAAQTPHVAPRTIKVYEDMARRVVATLGPRTASAPVGDLTQEIVEKALIAITRTKVKGTKRTITAATANMDLRALRRALGDAVKQGLARANAAEGVRPLPENDSTERAPFTSQEVRTLIDGASSDQWAGAILIAAHTGLRLGDVIRLNQSHVEGTRLVIRPEKTKHSRKTITVPLTPPCLGWMSGRHGDFFPDLKDCKTGTLSTQFVRMMDRNGIPRDITEAGDVTKRRSFHSLRHSFASWLADADVHADVRQRLTGHQSAGVHGRYTHHDEALERAVAKLPMF